MALFVTAEHNVAVFRQVWGFRHGNPFMMRNAM